MFLETLKNRSIFVGNCEKYLYFRELKPCCLCSGAQKLVAKIKEYNPKIAVFNGKGIYEVFSGQKEFIFGKQPDKITDTETVSVGKA